MPLGSTARLAGKRPGRDQPGVLSVWLQRTGTRPRRAETPYPGRGPVTAHLDGHAGAAASFRVLCSAWEPQGGPSAAARGVPPTTHCPTLACLRKLQTPTGYGATPSPSDHTPSLPDDTCLRFCTPQRGSRGSKRATSDTLPPCFLLICIYEPPDPQDHSQTSQPCGSLS